MRVATGHPFSVYLSEFRSCYQKFANFLDWIRDVQQVRIQDILKLPPSEPENLSLPQLDDGPSDDEDGEDTSGQEDEDPEGQEMKRKDVEREEKRMKDKKSEHQKRVGKKGTDISQERIRSHKSRIEDDAVSNDQIKRVVTATPTESPQVITSRRLRQDSRAQKKKDDAERKRQPQQDRGQGTAQIDGNDPGRKRKRRG